MFTPSPAAAATMNLRLAGLQMTNIGVPPRPRPVYRPRQRLQVQGFPEAPQSVKIRHASQNVGTVIGKTIETLPTQTRPV